MSVVQVIDPFVDALVQANKRTSLSSEHTMWTFTSKYTKSLEGKFRLLRRWQQFRILMTTTLPYREYRFVPIAWVIEYSENSVHLHCLVNGKVNARALNHAWVSLNRHDLGKVFVSSPGEDSSPRAILNYMYKSYSTRLDKFLGHFLILKSEDFL